MNLIKCCIFMADQTDMEDFLFYFEHTEILNKYFFP